MAASLISNVAELEARIGTKDAQVRGPCVIVLSEQSAVAFAMHTTIKALFTHFLHVSDTSWLAVNPRSNVHTLNETTGDLRGGYSGRTNICTRLTDV